MSFAAKGEKKYKNQDKQTPHTVLQKLSPKPTRTPVSDMDLWVFPNWNPIANLLP